MSNRTEDAVYCANELCENVAEYRIPSSDTPLCGVCAIPWGWGHANTQDSDLDEIKQPTEGKTQ